MFDALRRVVLFLALALTATAVAADVPAPLTILDPVVLPARNGQRPLLVRVTAPSHLVGTLPVILFSHGAALSRSHYAPLVDWWARQGFVVLQPDHEDAVVDGFPPPIAPSATLWRTRILDMKRLAHGLDDIAKAVPALRGHLDASRIVAAGHSFGAHTVAALMGARVWNADLGRYESFAEPAIRGAVLLSPPGSGGADLSAAWQARGGYLTVDWSGLRGPMLVMVGSADDSTVMAPRGAPWHADIYRRSTAAQTCLVTLTGARHYLGGIVDPRRSGVEDADPARLAADRAATLSLFRAALAGRRLSAATFEPLGTPGTVECR